MRHPDDLTGAEGGVAEHLDEGTIHAWLDGALAAHEAAAAERHVAGCVPCSAAVAEARGLIAGASRVLSALDGGLGAVSAVPRPPEPAATPPFERQVASAARRWTVPAWARAAAAVVVLAAGSAVVIGRTDAGGATERSTAQHHDSMVTFASRADSSAVANVAVPAPVAPRAPAVAMRVESTADAALTVSGGRARPAGAAASVGTMPPSARALAEQVAAAPAAPPVAPAPAAARALPGPPQAAATGAAALAVAADSVRASVLSGLVRDAGSLRPVEGAQVQISSLRISAVTDSAGRFTIQNVPAGAHVAIVRRIGYQAVERAVAVTGAEARELSVVMQPATTQLSAQRIVSEARPRDPRDSTPATAARARAGAASAAAAVDTAHRDALRPGERAAREVAREQESQRLTPSGAATQGLRAGSGRDAAVDVAGCYRLAPETGDGAAAPGLPAFVVLDTAGPPVARRLQLRYPSPVTGARPGGWRLGAGGPETAANAALAPVTVWWRDDRADWSMTLLRAGSVLSGTAVGTPTTERSTVPSRLRVRLTPTACGLLPAR